MFLCLKEDYFYKNDSMNLKLAVTIYIGFILFILCRFFINQKAVKLTFNKINEDLFDAIKDQKKQINYRQSKLGLYDFQAYNLEETLITQTDIKL